MSERDVATGVEHFNVVVEVAVPARWIPPADDPGLRSIGGYFLNVGVWARDRDAAEKLAAHEALYGQAKSGWFPPEGSVVVACEAEATDADDPPAGDEAVVFRSGFVFYPRKKWWQVWR